MTKQAITEVQLTCLKGYANLVDYYTEYLDPSVWSLGNLRKERATAADYINVARQDETGTCEDQPASYWMTYEAAIAYAIYFRTNFKPLTEDQLDSLA